jgi:hypothetical protein
LTVIRFKAGKMLRITRLSTNLIESAFDKVRMISVSGVPRPFQPGGAYSVVGIRQPSECYMLGSVDI